MLSAQQQGLLCEVDSEEEEDDKELCDPFFAHCKAHADKDIAKRKVKSYHLCFANENLWLSAVKLVVYFTNNCL